MRFFSVVFKIIVAIAALAGITAYVISQSVMVKQAIEKRIIQEFDTAYNCVWQGRITSVSLFPLSATICDMSIKPKDETKQWSIVVDSLQTKGSLLQLITSRKLVLDAYYTDAVLQEYTESYPQGLHDFFEQLFEGGTDSFLQMPYTQVHKGMLVMQNKDATLRHSYSFNTEFFQDYDGTHMQMFLTDGSVHYQDKEMIMAAHGKIQAIFPTDNDRTKIVAQVDCGMQVPMFADQKDCFVTGSMQAGHGTFVVSNHDKSFVLEPITVQVTHDKIPVKFTMNIALDLLRSILFPFANLAKINGKITTTFQGDLKDSFSVWKSKLNLEQVIYKGIDIISKGEISFSRHDDEYKAAIKVGDDQYSGSIKASDDGLFFYLKNLTPIDLFGTYWKMHSEKTAIQGSIGKDGSAQGTFFAQLMSDKLQEKKDVQGAFSVEEKKLHIHASFDDKQVDMLFDFSHAVPAILHVLCTRHQEGKAPYELLSCVAQDDAGLLVAGHVDFKCIQEFVPPSARASFMQDGKIEFSAQLENGIYYVFAHSQDAHIRIPGIYNVIDSMQAKVLFDLMNRKILVQDLMAHLYEGSLRSTQEVYMLPEDGGLFVHVPLFLDKMLISWYKGIYGIFSGRLLLYHEQEALKLRGDLLLDAAQLKGNIFSTEFQKKLFHQTMGTEQLVLPACELDFYIANKEPIVIDTSFLQAQAHVNMHVQGTAQQPIFVGDVTIESGELHFPYKALTITHGKISCAPHQQDPVFEFTARGRIKRHTVTLRATGSIHEQHITLESTPHLNEEQIVSLLLIGSEDSSLTTVMPAVLMQQLNSLIFGPAMGQSKLNAFFNKLLTPLQRVRFYPQFINQSGRGGVRAIVEIDATDSLHGKIDSNLMHFEDTKFEVDYTLTDDVMLRGMKDGPGAYGGEIEMKWKFS